MTTNGAEARCCEPQHFPEGNPTKKWTLEELESYAKAKHQEIVAHEKPLARQYWQLGLTLHLARAKFKHGTWGKHLKSLGIEKTRASKAQAIYKAIPKEDDTADLSVEAAYARRRRKTTPPSKPAVMGDKAEFREFLKTIRIDSEKYFGVATLLKPTEAPEFILDVTNVIEVLDKIMEELRHRVTPDSSDH
jgi:hypothetical protein